MTQFLEWADQLRTELEKQSSARACQLEALLIASDYQAIRDFIDFWEDEDRDAKSLAQRYQTTVKLLRSHSWMKTAEALDGSAEGRTIPSATSQTTAENEL